MVSAHYHHSDSPSSDSDSDSDRKSYSPEEHGDFLGDLFGGVQDFVHNTLEDVGTVAQNTVNGGLNIAQNAAGALHIPIVDHIVNGAADLTANVAHQGLEIGLGTANNVAGAATNAANAIVN